MWRVLLIAILFTYACTLGGGSEPSLRSLDEPASPTSEVPAVPSGTFLRDCETSVFGTLGRGWREDAIVVGDIAFVALPAYATGTNRFFRARPGEAVPAKVLVVIPQGQEVTVRVPAEYRDRLALQYDPAHFNERWLAAGDAGVTFRACAPGQSPFGTDRATQFNGAFLVTRPQCSAIEVIDADAGSTRVPVSFAAGHDCRG